MNLDSAKQIASLVFSDSYAKARRKFLSASVTSRAYRCSTPGPAGDDIFTDVSYYGDPNADNLLILISGTHGPEGYCGSAAQLSFLQAKFHEKLPASTAVLLIHALNAYGFAWDRRVTAEGCDLNRNFVDFTKPLPPNAGYEELADHIVPFDISPEGIRSADAAIEIYRAKHGDRELRASRSRGQYTRPKGMFYGGTEPSEARRTLEQIVRDFNVSSRRTAVIVDYHTGLGPYGYGELQCEQPSGLQGYERAVKIFGPSVTSPDLGTSSAVVLHGTLDEFWEREMGPRHTYVCLEFGTYNTERAREALRNDHWLFSYRPHEADSELGRHIRQATKSYFYPQSADWMEMVIARSHMVHRQAMAALAIKS